MRDLPLSGKSVLVTGAGRRIGRALALACARAGADIVVHYGYSAKEAAQTRDEIASLGRRAWAVPADLSRTKEISDLMLEASRLTQLFGLINSAAVFESLSLETTSPVDWERHIAVNLTAPFLLIQAFARQIPKEGEGRIINILDWRALRPGADHFPYTVSKAALAAMTESLAIALAPNIHVNGLALGAILPPSDGRAAPDILKNVPAARWGELAEVEEALIWLLTGPGYVTGEIIHVDGGRHLV